MSTEPAPAKLNLTLDILGRRPDGYHDLSSLVVFADCGDTLSVTPSTSFSLTVGGPFATAIDGKNLVAEAVARATARAPRLVVGTFHLEKRLPIAAGLGGGSSDAAAAIRLLRRLNPTLEGAIDWLGLARALGADVPVCLTARAAHMGGIGDRVALLPTLPRLWAVLANPGVPLATATVFRDLAAPPVAPTAPPSPPARFGDAAQLIAYVAAGRNDLEAAARRLCPAVADVLAAVAALPGVALTRMSGSGPTCFGLFQRSADATAAAAQLTRQRPTWWVSAAELT